jgi:hypothetical protein
VRAQERESLLAVTLDIGRDPCHDRHNHLLGASSTECMAASTT